jgi:Arc/MetJ-type ribon-helix-helix transcriptional regulator
MDTATRTRPRRVPSATTKTAGFNLDLTSLNAVNRLVDRGVFPNKSAAVDEALRLLRTYYADHLREDGTNVA